MKKYSLLSVILLLFSNQAFSTGVLEVPPNGGYASGISLISGWHCSATNINIFIDAKPAKAAAYGTPRGDTAGVCGDTDNGFGFLYNFNLLGPGVHTIRVEADGVEFATSTFTVATFLENFVSGASGSVQIADFTYVGDMATLVWQESSQSFVLSDFVPVDANRPFDERVIERLAGTVHVPYFIGDSTFMQEYTFDGSSIFADGGFHYIWGMNSIDTGGILANYNSSIDVNVFGIFDPTPSSFDRFFGLVWQDAYMWHGCYFHLDNGQTDLTGETCYEMYVYKRNGVGTGAGQAWATVPAGSGNREQAASDVERLADARFSAARSASLLSGATANASTGANSTFNLQAMQDLLNRVLAQGQARAETGK